MFNGARRKFTFNGGLSGLLAKKIVYQFSGSNPTERKDINTISRLIFPEKKRFLIAAVTSALSSGLFMLYP